MTKSKTDVIAEAHRRIGVLSVDESPSDDMLAFGGSAAESLLDEMCNHPYNMALTFSVDTMPDAAFRPFSWLLAVDLGVHYATPTEGRSRAVQRLAAYAYRDDRHDRRDTDGDGVISEAEEQAGNRAAYF